MFDQWHQLQTSYDKLNEELLQPNLDNKRRAEVQKQVSIIAGLLEIKKEIDEIDQAISNTQQQVKEVAHDFEMKQLFEQELSDLDQAKIIAQKKLDDLLYPVDELADRPAFLEIRAGTGGQEAALFVGDLLKMYIHYATKMGWRTELVSESLTDLGGFKEVILHVTGKNVYGYLQYESGVHRVQRVPATETAGRVHTSTATVAVLPEAQEVEININPSDLRIDVYRASGAGGQHVNTTDSAVRITHIPTGVVVSCQDERSQHKNKAKALKVLGSRILADAKEKQRASESQERKSQVGTGERSEKIRTYNYPQNRVTDHQVEVTLKKLDMVMLGEMHEIIDALQDMDRLERRKKASIFSFLQQ